MTSLAITLRKMINAITDALVGSYKQHYVVRVGTAFRQYERESRLLNEKKVLIPTTGADKINLKNDTKNVVKDINKSKSMIVKEMDLCL